MQVFLYVVAYLIYNIIQNAAKGYDNVGLLHTAKYDSFTLCKTMPYYLKFSAKQFVEVFLHHIKMFGKF